MNVAATLGPVRGDFEVQLEVDNHTLLFPNELIEMCSYIHYRAKDNELFSEEYVVVDLTGLKVAEVTNVMEYCKYAMTAKKMCLSDEDTAQWRTQFVDMDGSSIIKTLHAAELMGCKELADFLSDTLHRETADKTDEELYEYAFRGRGLDDEAPSGVVVADEDDDDDDDDGDEGSDLDEDE